nr:restriction endonuclease subunit S [Alkalispirochaeta alkalica]
MMSSIKYPAGWTSKRLKYLASYNDEVLSENTDDLTEIDYVEISGVSLSGGVEEINRMTFFEAPSRARRKVRSGDILVSTVRTYLRAIAAVDEASDDLIASTGFCVIRPQEQADSPFLGWVAKSEPFISEVVTRSVGVSYPAINASELVTINVPRPPLETQRRIAQFLDEKTARIDGLIEKKRALLDRLAEKRQALITRAVTKGLNPDAPMKPSGIDWLGDIPAHWEVKRFRFIAKLISGSTPTTSVSEYWNGDIPWISPKDMKSDELFTSEDKVTEYAVNDYRLRLHEQDNAVIVIRGMILARKVPVAVAKGRYTINQDMKVIHSKGDVIPAFIQMYLSSIESFLFTLIAEAGHGTKALRTDVLLDIPFLAPPLSEQYFLIDHLANNRKQTDQTIEKISESVSLLKEYRAALITAAVTGQLEVA